MDLLQPRSVVDFGCGLGEWAQQFKTLGAVDVIGVDGVHVNQDDLAVSADEFIRADLTLPIDLGRRFDLAVSLEVAEHLPESSADQFVSTLAHHASAVLFSAAIPYQGGEHHVNEQWPDYWATRFASCGYKAFDVLRQQVWNNSRVEWWYAQNVMIYATGDSLDPLLEHGHTALTPSEVLSLVHPQNYERQFWTQRVLSMCLDLIKVVPAGARLLLVDDDADRRLHQLLRELRSAPTRRAIPGRLLAAAQQLLELARQQGRYEQDRDRGCLTAARHEGGG